MSFNPLSQILKDNLLTGENYTDWKRNLDIVLIAEGHSFVLYEPRPADPADGDTEEVKAYHKKWLRADELARCYILASLSSVLQHQHQHMVTASDMMVNLKDLFCHQNRAARQIAMRNLVTQKMAEGTPVRAHVLKMMGYLNELEILGGGIDGESQVDLILQSLPKSFEQFSLNYRMNGREYTLAELLQALQSAEVLMTGNRKV